MAPAPYSGRHQALYRALLRLYPRSFRDEYAEPMAQLFGDHLREVGSRAWLRALPDLLRSVPPERIEASMARLGTGAIVLALLGAVVGTAAVVIGVAGPVPLLALAVVVLLFGLRGLFTSISYRDRAPLRAALVQTWWAPVAGVLGLTMVVFGFATIFEAHNWGGRIVGSSVLMAFGFATLFGLMQRPFNRVAGNSLILISTIPPMAFFWVIVPPVAAIIVWIGVLSGGFSEPAGRDLGDRVDPRGTVPGPRHGRAIPTSTRTSAPDSTPPT